MSWIHLAVVKKMWYQELKSPETYHIEVIALQFLNHLSANYSSLHEIDAVEIQGSIMEFYAEVEGIPHFINMMEEGQEKATRVDLQIDDNCFHATAIKALLTSEDYTAETYE